MRGTWRDEIAPMVDAVISVGRALGLEGPDLERYVRKNSWKFGSRENHPYRIWCDEVNRQLGIRRETPRSTRPMPLFGE